MAKSKNKASSKKEKHKSTSESDSQGGKDKRSVIDRHNGTQSSTNSQKQKISSQGKRSEQQKKNSYVTPILVLCVLSGIVAIAGVFLSQDLQQTPVFKDYIEPHIQSVRQFIQELSDSDIPSHTDQHSTDQDTAESRTKRDDDLKKGESDETEKKEAENVLEEQKAKEKEEARRLEEERRTVERKEQEEREAKKKEEERIAAEKKAEEERKAAQKRAEEEKRKEEERKKAEEERIADQKRQEKERDEKKRKEEERIAAEKRAVKERAEKRKKEEERVAAEKKAEKEKEEKRKKEEERIAAEKKAEKEKEEKKKKEERIAAEKSADEERRRVEKEKEEKRKEEERKEAERKAEEDKQASERKAEQEREEKRKEKEKNAEEKKKEKEREEKKKEEERKAAERKAEEERKAAEKKAQEEREAQRKEEERISADKKKSEEKKDADKKAEEEKKNKEKDKNASEQKEAKNAKEVKSEPSIDRATYKFASITNDADFKFREELDEADALLEKGDIETAIDKYDLILRRTSQSPRGYYGKALTLDKLAFKQRSNEYLEEAIEYLVRILSMENVPSDLFKMAGRKLADRQQFRGWGGKATETFKFLCNLFPDDLELQKEHGVSYMMIGQNEKAREVFKKILQTEPESGFAKVHLGFIYKTVDNELEGAVKLLSEGIDSQEPGVVDGRFYMHLGDSLIRLGREPEARKIYQAGEDHGLFLSAWQRSLYNVDHLTGRPWWTPEQTGYQNYLKLLQDNWATIRDEGLAQLDKKSGTFVPEEENLRHTGDWKQFTLFQQGRKNTDNCQKAPKTCALIEQIPDAKGCRRGQVKFSVMSPGIHVWPHVGPTNCRLRAHLGLKVPEGPSIRVVDEIRKWKEGEFLIFDDSFEHEVWHNGTEWRLVLIVDFWHPEISEQEKRTLSSI